jgi:hypothetical protein
MEYPDFKLHDKIIPLPNIDKRHIMKVEISLILSIPSRSAPAPHQIVERQQAL